MAKRFTDTNKYKKPFIRSLPLAYKLLWDFLYHDCDHAGIWITDFAIARVYIGDDANISKEETLRLFNSDEQRIIEIDNGKKWFIPSFIEFQYGHLSEKNRAHINVIAILKKFDLLNKDLTIKNFLLKPLTSPLQGVKEKEQVQEKEMELEKEKEQEQELEQEDFEKSEKLLIPEMLTIWKKNKPGYPTDRSKDYVPLQSIAVFICQQEGMLYRPRDSAISKTVFDLWGKISKFVSLHSFFKNYSLQQVEKHIQSITQEIQNGTGKNQHRSGSAVSTASAFSKIDSMPDKT